MMFKTLQLHSCVVWWMKQQWSCNEVSLKMGRNLILTSHYVLNLEWSHWSVVCVQVCVLVSVCSDISDKERVSEGAWESPSSHYALLPVCLQASLLAADLFEFNLRETLGERQWNWNGEDECMSFFLLLIFGKNALQWITQGGNIM